MKFGFISIYVHFLKAFCDIESIKSCLLPFPSNSYCISIKVTVDLQRPNFAKKFFFAHSKAKTQIYGLVKKVM